MPRVTFAPDPTTFQYSSVTFDSYSPILRRDFSFPVVLSHQHRFPYNLLFAHTFLHRPSLFIVLDTSRRCPRYIHITRRKEALCPHNDTFLDSPLTIDRILPPMFSGKLSNEFMVITAQEGYVRKGCYPHACHRVQ